jgi:hypothetical protein
MKSCGRGAPGEKIGAPYMPARGFGASAARRGVDLLKFGLPGTPLSTRVGEAVLTRLQRRAAERLLPARTAPKAGDGDDRLESKLTTCYML